ncbi:hypothetical protein [Kitasatospora sp. SUK 42]|uniref:hypothetical protein n=1 Tax=Kitasatospora sp. SUK 42 TaxID=1588882 RepID=UPI0018C92751|nr:hypothetical protein [Kitasatospora sp. SUK 42]MBV2155061.1 hypothetical protein [Kitasatospora sp. SUK 42]
MRSLQPAEQEDLILGVPPANDQRIWERLAEENEASAGLVGSWTADAGTDGRAAHTQPESATHEPSEVDVQAGWMDELPLWAGQGTAEPVRARSATDEAGLPDLKAQLREVVAAWKEIVPEGRSTADDLRLALEADVEALQVRWQQVAVALGRPARPVTERATVHPAAGQGAEAVNAALRDADRCSPTLHGAPEWQQLRAVREAVGHLWRTLTVGAGEYAGRLLADQRVSEFLRNVSIHACEAIARLAHLGSDRLRRGQVALPSAETLLALGNAAGAYSMSARGQGSAPAPEAGPPSLTVDVPGLRRMGEALRRPGPMSAQLRSVSASAARARSACRLPKRPAVAAGEQPAHLRHGGSAVQPGRKPNQR